jgi:WD40 repeat protein
MSCCSGRFVSLLGQIRLLTGDPGGELRIYSMKDFTELRRIHAQENSVRSMQSDRSKTVSGRSDGVVKEWDFRSGEVLREFVASDTVWRVGYAGGRIAALFSGEGNVVLGVSGFLSVITDQVIPGDSQASTNVSWEVDLGSSGSVMRRILNEHSESTDQGLLFATPSCFCMPMQIEG